MKHWLAQNILVVELFRLLCSDQRHMTITWLWNAKKKKKKLQALGNKTPDRNHPARFMPWEKASEQRRKFCCGAHWVRKKGGKAHKPAGTQRGGTMGSQEGSPNSCWAPHPNSHTDTHIYTLIHFSPLHTLWPGHLKGGQRSRCCATDFTKSTSDELRREKKGKGGQTSLFSPAALNRRLEQPSDKLLCLGSFQLWLSARFIVDVQVLFRPQGQTSFRLTKSVLSFAPALPGGKPDAGCGSKSSAEESLIAAR